MANLNYAVGKAGSLTLRKNGIAGVELYSPYANKFDMSVSSDEDYAMANGSRAVKFSSNKQMQIAMEFDVFEVKLLSILFGMSSTTGATSLFVREVFTPSTPSITLSASPLANSVSVYKLEADLVGHKSEIEEGTPATNPDEYSISGTTITLNAADVDIPIVVYYTKTSAGTAINNKVISTQFNGGYTLDFVTTMTAKYDNSINNVNVIARNAVPAINSTISFTEGTHATVSVTFDLFPDANDVMVEMIQI